MDPDTPKRPDYPPRDYIPPTDMGDHMERQPDHNTTTETTDAVITIPLERFKEYAFGMLGIQGDEARVMMAIEILANAEIHMRADDLDTAIEIAEEAKNNAWDAVHEMLATLSVINSDHEEACE